MQQIQVRFLKVCGNFMEFFSPNVSDLLLAEPVVGRTHRCRINADHNIIAIFPP